MCNAWNHAPDCACGFGPPYSGSLVPVGRESWLRAASRSEERFRQALYDLHLTDDLIEEDLRLYRANVMSALAAGDPRRATSQLRNIVRRRTRKVDATGSARVEIPLFKLHSPLVPGSKVTWQETTAETKGGSWSVTIFGTGMGADQTFKVMLRRAYSNQDGEYDLIFASVKMRWWLVSLYERSKKGKQGELISSALEAEVDPDVRRHPLGRGARPLSEAELLEDMKFVLEPPLAKLELEQANRPWTDTYTWEKESEVDVRLGVPKLGIVGAVRAKVRPQRAVELTFELPGGHEYWLLSLAKAPGIVCKVAVPDATGASPPREGDVAVTATATSLLPQPDQGSKPPSIQRRNRSTSCAGHLPSQGIDPSARRS